MMMKRLPALPLVWATLTTLLLRTTTASSSPSIAALAQRDDDDSKNASSAFVHSTVYGNITFAVSTVTQTGDLYFHLEAPADNSWVAVGSGKEMKGSLMWVVYKSEDEKGITLSPRTATGHVEPSYERDIPCNLDDTEGARPTGIVDRNGKSYFIVNALCHNVNNRASFKRSLARREADDLDSDGILNFDNDKQNFIFACGPTDRHLHDDSKEVGIRRHTLYGGFTMDLKSATVESSIDAQKALAAFDTGAWQMKNAQLVSGPEKDRDWSSGIHSLLMCGTFVILFPIGVVFLRLLEKVMWHAIMQGIGVVFIVIGVGLGIYVGREYNQSRTVRSAHQILGLTIAALTLLQFGLGLTHHLIYRRTQKPTLLGKIHLYLGPCVLAGGALNGFLGFRFSGGSYHNIMYGAIVAVIFIVLAGLLVWTARRKKTRGRRKAGGEAYEGFAHRGADTGYAGRDHIPLRSVPSEEPPPYEAARGVQPRNMV
ncbi:iron reductase domain protein [Trematosphaeria pertusa]|uniref:Iron reductase domain protein n=1 Tax=Trematosphaeria pertusa TaxID=390896 RepID=A0A6A6IAY1_9PLEO|nr:iron reductase domain protein [Trematosphaeria pertusa]KAF2247367.1 iron reductase domain protein [Trematosphaeria pertusa]